jgi:hypothetical protein
MPIKGTDTGALKVLEGTREYYHSIGSPLLFDFSCLWYGNTWQVLSWAAFLFLTLAAYGMVRLLGTWKVLGASTAQIQIQIQIQIPFNTDTF